MGEFVRHTLPPVYRQDSKILILGSMPSPKSREAGFYYGHPQNRFWRVLAAVFSAPIPVTNDEKRSFLLARKIALWDVLSSCVIEGADDGSIRKPESNRIETILSAAPIRAVFTTGGAATNYYRRLCLPQTGVESIPLPSTSPANCRCHMDELIQKYRVILNYLKP